MKTKLQFIASIFAAIVLLMGVEAQAQELEGKWVLVKRVLPDGTVLTPPTVQGQFSVHKGLTQLVVYWPMPNGNPASLSSISQWEWSYAHVTVTPMLRIFDDGSGKPPAYAVGGSAKSSPLTRSGNVISYQHPFDPPFNVSDGEKLTAIFEGVFVDHWEKVH